MSGAGVARRVCVAEAAPPRRGAPPFLQRWCCWGVVSSWPRPLAVLQGGWVRRQGRGVGGTGTACLWRPRLAVAAAAAAVRRPPLGSRRPTAAAALGRLSRGRRGGCRGSTAAAGCGVGGGAAMVGAAMVGAVTAGVVAVAGRSLQVCGSTSTSAAPSLHLSTPNVLLPAPRRNTCRGLRTRYCTPHDRRHAAQSTHALPGYRAPDENWREPSRALRLAAPRVPTRVWLLWGHWGGCG